MRKRSLALLAILLSVSCVFFAPSTAKAESSTPQNGVDLMIICAHPGDEYLFLSGALSLYAGEQGRSAVVVYLSQSDEATQTAAKAALARYGDQVQAVFGTFSADYADSKDLQLRYWDSRAVITYLVGVIREYKPAIVLTHQPLGEYGNGAHIVTSDSVFMAVRYAPEANRYKESSALYGAWQVQRLFFHQYGENMVTLDRSKPIARFDGLTALELDQQGYAYYPTTYPIKMTDGVGYTSAQYGLASAVDATSFDPGKGDLFAGLDASLLGPTAEPYVAPSPTPQASEPAADTAAIAAATPVTTAQTAQAETAPSNTTDIPNTALLIGCAALGVLALIGAVLLKKGTRLKIVAIIVCGVFLLGAIFFAVRYFQHKPDDASASEPQDAAAKLAPTPMPSDSMEPTAEPEPTPTPDPWDPYFRSASDPEEVVVIDLENEHWEYRTDTLSIIIDRVHITKPDKKPITYCIANIRMRGEDAFMAGVRNDNPLEQPSLEHAWHMARRYRAVLGITGDNLIQAEVNDKGILMRNGKVYSENQAQDILAFYPDDLTIKIYKPKTISVEELKEQGVLNTFSFGPTLLNNGVRDLSSRRSMLGRQNPRTGIGMVEPGHFIAITVDGRQNKYSVGMTIEELTQMFYLLGCQTAYNLDGGASTAMIFMGECLNQHTGTGSDVQRPWTDGLFWGKSELVPTVDDPVYNTGAKPWVMPPT